MNLEKLAYELRGLAVFRCILKNELVGSLVKLFEEKTPENMGSFAERLYAEGDNLSDALLNIVLLSENLCSVKAAKSEIVSEALLKRMNEELEIIKKASLVKSGDFADMDMLLPSWSVKDIDFKAEFESRLKGIKKTGYGVFADNYMFTLEDGEIVPTIFKDDTTVESLKGYERQRKYIDDNIRALLKGKVAANMLLYGDSGTGKSATVKALTNKYANEGLRLIEIKKSQIDELPYIMGRVSSNPLKFILFLDDLTFDPSDDSFSSMKAVLEGSVAARAKNTCICVTSNRRHLVKESAKDREMGDLHLRDTMEEIGALTQRFGLSVVYEKPDRISYVNVLKEIAADYGIDIGESEIKEAEAYAISKGGRSCRVAKQYVEELIRRMD